MLSVIAQSFFGSGPGNKHISEMNLPHGICVVPSYASSASLSSNGVIVVDKKNRRLVLWEKGGDEKYIATRVIYDCVKEMSIARTQRKRQPQKEGEEDHIVLQSPRDVAFSQTRRLLFVSDSATHAVFGFSFTTTVSSSCSNCVPIVFGMGELESPHGVDTLDDLLAVADTHHDRVCLFDIQSPSPAPQHVLFASAGLLGPLGVALGRHGRRSILVAVTDYRNHRVLVAPLNNGAIISISLPSSSPLRFPVGVCFLPRARYGDDDDDDGEGLSRIAIADNNNNRVVVCEFSATYSEGIDMVAVEPRCTFIMEGDMKFPASVAADTETVSSSTTRLFVTDHSNHRVLVADIGNK